MSHVFQPAPTGRAKCRGCGHAIAAGSVRFGESLPNPFAEGETTHWFHPECGAYKRPEPFLEALEATAERPPEADRLAKAARLGVAHRRLPRIDGAERATSARARCRSCREPIEKAAWRLRLVFYEEGRFAPGGFVHATCALAYFGTRDVLARIRRFAPTLGEAEAGEIDVELAKGVAGAGSEGGGD